MSEYQHTGLADGRWAQMSLAEQMLNIGSEVSRANRWKSKGNVEQCHRAADRALELLSLTINAQRGMHDLGEFCRLYEVLADTTTGIMFTRPIPSNCNEVSIFFIPQNNHS